MEESTQKVKLERVNGEDGITPEIIKLLGRRKRTISSSCEFKSSI